jgi:hypothetical protein
MGVGGLLELEQIHDNIGLTKLIDPVVVHLDTPSSGKVAAITFAKQACESVVYDPVSKSVVPAALLAGLCWDFGLHEWVHDRQNDWQINPEFPGACNLVYEFHGMHSDTITLAFGKWWSVTVPTANATMLMGPGAARAVITTILTKGWKVITVAGSIIASISVAVYKILSWVGKKLWRVAFPAKAASKLAEPVKVALKGAPTRFKTVEEAISLLDTTALAGMKEAGLKGKPCLTAVGTVRDFMGEAPALLGVSSDRLGTLYRFMVGPFRHTVRITTPVLAQSPGVIRNTLRRGVQFLLTASVASDVIEITTNVSPVRRLREAFMPPVIPLDVLNSALMWLNYVAVKNGATPYSFNDKVFVEALVLAATYPDVLTDEYTFSAADTAYLDVQLRRHWPEAKDIIMQIYEDDGLPTVPVASLPSVIAPSRFETRPSSAPEPVIPGLPSPPPVPRNSPMESVLDAWAGSY